MENIINKLKNNQRVIIWSFIGVLFLATVFVVFQAGQINSIDIAQGISSGIKASSSGMVGGC